MCVLALQSVGIRRESEKREEAEREAEHGEPLRGSPPPPQNVVCL